MKKRYILIFFLLGMISTLVVGMIVTSFDGVILLSKTKYDRLLELEDTYKKVDELKEAIEKDFYLEIQEDTLLDGIYKGLFEATGDKYSVYMTKDEFEDYNNSTNGNYVGIGVLSDVSEGDIHVTRVFPNSPAEKIGILAGDYIIEVDGEKIEDVGYKALINTMLGDEGTPVEVIVIRDDERLVFNLERGKVEIPFVSSSVIEDIGYIHIYQFGTDVSNDFDDHYKKLISDGVKGIVIDVRNNPGGLVSQSTAIADDLMGEGLIIYTLDNEGNRKEYKSNKSKSKVPIVMLSNGSSASASEILLGAIQDSDSGEVIGSQSFGKGIIQSVSSLRDGSGYKLTFSQYYTPSGQEIHKIGITPDYIVEYEGIIDGEKPDIENDLQLIKAIEVLKKDIQ